MGPEEGEVSGKNVHQSWDSERQQWKVGREGASRASGYRDTESEARKWSQKLAKDSGSEWIKHRKDDGRIHQRNSYGDDPFPPRG
ncbi:DUF2188 domain-containing protein [Corynebacterium diphtheriae]|nr:DUF2188 domain-containing protein [Corynebacterium diphtheriae]MBG9276882.1 DUF2188 domain-containing protein [Corynebacterium diphtheriae bv. mitis]OWM93511.1 hypothetical protein AY492_01925 [Corynebacterium diphtheriae bv. gravis]MBG9281266.1 DUF2188 domain-containing protein [Corynebacterium diphtheriae bv. mitis]MBG9294789.1 DUF2188 domain-containing protein [Corynebacterium diphtheriae bv. mitis]